MKKLEKIKEQILAIIQKEESKTRSELEVLSRKQQDNMDFYGIGGPYQRYEHAIERRRNHLSELEALRKTQASVVVLESLRLYGYFCPSCNEKFTFRTKILKLWTVQSAAAGFTKMALTRNGMCRKTADIPVCTGMIPEKGGITRWHYTKNWIYGPSRTAWTK